MPSMKFDEEEFSSFEQNLDACPKPNLFKVLSGIIISLFTKQ